MTAKKGINGDREDAGAQTENDNDDIDTNNDDSHNADHDTDTIVDEHVNAVSNEHVTHIDNSNTEIHGLVAAVALRAYQ